MLCKTKDTESDEEYRFSTQRSERLPSNSWLTRTGCPESIGHQGSVHIRDEGEEEYITIPVRGKDYEQEGHEQEEQEEGEDGVDEEEEEEEDEECGDDDGYTLRFHGEMDPMKFAEEDASGAQPYEQFERLKCEALAERERKRKALNSCSNEAGKKARQEGFFGANIDEIMEAVDFSSRRRSRQPKKRGRKKGSKSKLSPEVMEKLGIANLHYAFGRFDEALNVLKEVVRLAPNLADSYHMLGLVYSAIGDKKKALNFYMIAAHLTPKDAFLWKRLVDWSMELGNMGQVIYCLSKAISADPEDMGLGFKRASLYIERGDYQKAAESFDQILRMHPADVEACKMCAKMYCTFGQKEKAVEILERYVQDHFAAADLNLFNFLVTLLMEDKFYQRALEHIERARSVYCLKKLPLYLSVKAGICYAYLGEIEKSEMLFMDLQMQNVGGCTDLLWEAANAMMSVGRYESALKYLLLLNEIPGHSGGPLYLKIAQCYLHLKENEKAVHFSYKAVGVMEDSVDARLTLASLLCQENKEDEAISLLIPPDSLGPTSNDPSATDSVAWWRSTDIRKKLAKIYLGREMLAEFVDTIFPVIHETLLIEITNMKVRMRKKLPKSVLSERVKLLDVEQSDVIFRGFRPIASSTDMTKASRARKKLQQIAAEKEEKRAAALAAGQEWQSDDSDDEPQRQAVREPPLPNLLKDDEHYQLLVDLCKALASLHRFWEELEIINRSLKAGEHILPAERKEELRTLGAQVAYRTRDPTHGYDYARYMVQKHPYSMAAWNCYYKVVSRMENRFSKHSKFLLSMRGKYKDCVPPIMICGHQFSMNSQHQMASREYLEAYKLQPDNPLINLCVGTALINLALGLRVQNKNQCVAQGLAFLYNYQHLSQNSQRQRKEVIRDKKRVATGWFDRAACRMGKATAPLFYTDWIVSEGVRGFFFSKIMAVAAFTALWSPSIPVGGGVRSRSEVRLVLRRQARAGAAPMATEKLGVKIERSPPESRLSELGVRKWPKWGCPPSKFPWTYTDRETCYLLEGKVKVYPDGHDDYVEIGAGDLVVFPKGMKCTWDVSQAVDKHYNFG